MPEEPKPDVPADARPSVNDKDYPTLCGTMLLYAGIIQIAPEHLQAPESKDETKGPTFI